MTGPTAKTTNTIEADARTNEGPKEKDRYRVKRGGPGQNIVTPFKDGEPVIENPPTVPASPSSSTLPAVIPEKDEEKPIVLSRYDKKANLRFALIVAVNQEAAKEGGPKVKTIDKLLDLYNSGLLLPGLFKDLGHVSRRTFYRHLEELEKDGIEGLAPKYGQSGRKAFAQVSFNEKKFLQDCYFDEDCQNRLKISDIIHDCKKLFGEESTSSPSTLRRYLKSVRKYNHGAEIMAREGLKAWNDKCAPWQGRNPMLLKFGEALVADGHKLNVQVIDPISGRPKRPELILFWDWKSTFPVGWEIAFSENAQSIWTALFNALITVGKLPDTILVDNGKAFRSGTFTKGVGIWNIEIPGMFERLREIEPGRTDPIIYRHSPPYHPQSKPVERFFRILNDRLERRLPSYVGSSIEDKPAYLLPHEPRAKALHNKWIPKVSDLKQIMYQWIEEYIDEPLPRRQGLTPRQMFDEGKGPGFDPPKLMFLMMDTKVGTVARCRFRFAGIDWESPCLYEYKGKIVIRYSLADFSKIYVFDPQDGSYMGEATQTIDAHPVKDSQAAKRIQTLRQAYKRETERRLDASHENSFLLEGRQPAGMIEYIRTEGEKKPQTKMITAFLDIPEDEAPDEQPKSSEEKTETDEDDGSRLLCPRFDAIWEMYEWYYGVDREKYRIIDLGWIDWVEDGFWGRNWDDESTQRRYEWLASKHRTDTNPDGENKENRKDYRLGCDPAVEKRWRDIKNSIVHDPISGLSCPAEGLPPDDDRVRYEFYRGIEKRFPNTLTDNDWKWIRKYEGMREWEFIFHESEIYPLTRRTEDHEGSVHPDEEREAIPDCGGPDTSSQS